jgi:hypothetical protein
MHGDTAPWLQRVFVFGGCGMHPPSQRLRERLRPRDRELEIALRSGML